MAEHLGIARRVVLHHDVHVGQVQPTCRHVRAQQDGGVRSLRRRRVALDGGRICARCVRVREGVERGVPPLGGLLAVERKELERLRRIAAAPGVASEQWIEVVDLGARSKVHDKLACAARVLVLVRLRLVAQDAQQLCKLVLGSGDVVVVLQRRRQPHVAAAFSEALGALLLDLDHHANRVPQSDTHKLRERLGHRGAKQACAPLLGQIAQERAERGGEAEVQEPVCLVEHEHLKLRLAHARLAQQLLEPPGGPDQDLGALIAERHVVVRWRGVRAADAQLHAAQRARIERGLLAVLPFLVARRVANDAPRVAAGLPLEHVGHDRGCLLRKLARRAHDHSANLSLPEGVLAPAEDLEHGNHKRKRLARARDRLGHHVLVREKQRDGRRLHRGHVRKLHL